MAPVTRSSIKRSLTLAPHSSSTPAPKKRRGASQARVSESLEQLVWYGGENTHQDVSIRLVRYDTINNEVDDGRTLARLMVHSSRLESCSSYFSAALSQKWTSNRSPQELTFHVQGDVRLYTDCFSRMYSPFMVGFKSVEYSLQLLAVATHLACDDLMSSICLYLASVCPWSENDEMRIRSSVLLENFPRGHAQDLLERLESRLTRDDLRPLISRCIERGNCSLSYGTPVSLGSLELLSASLRSLGSSAKSYMEAWDLLDHLLVTARGQERSPTPTFEQEAVCVINEEFELLVVAANVEAEAAGTMEDNLGLLNTVYTIQQVLDSLLRAGMADEAVKCFAQYSSFPKLIGDAVRNEFYGDGDVGIVVDTMTWTVVSILSDLVSGDLHVEESARDALFLEWLPLLNWLHINAVEALVLHKMEYCEEYRNVKEALLSMRPNSQELKEIIDQVLVV